MRWSKSSSLAPWRRRKASAADLLTRAGDIAAQALTAAATYGPLPPFAESRPHGRLILASALKAASFDLARHHAVRPRSNREGVRYRPRTLGQRGAGKTAGPGPHRPVVHAESAGMPPSRLAHRPEIDRRRGALLRPPCERRSIAGAGSPRGRRRHLVAQRRLRRFAKPPGVAADDPNFATSALASQPDGQRASERNPKTGCARRITPSRALPSEASRGACDHVQGEACHEGRC